MNRERQIELASKMPERRDALAQKFREKPDVQAYVRRAAQALRDKVVKHLPSTKSAEKTPSK